MAVRICILGNSHVASLRNAWSAREEKADAITLDFFAAPGSDLAALELKDGYIRANNELVSRSLRYTSGGRDSFRPEDYDVFLVLGLSLAIPALPKATSSAVVSQCCEDTIASSLALPLGLMVRFQTDARIYVGHVPLIGASKPTPWHRPYEEVYEVMKAKFDRHGMHLLRQPAETVLSPCKTELQFSAGAERLLPDPQTQQVLLFPDDEFRHMNAAYGHLYLRDFFARLVEDRAAEFP